MSMRSVSRIPGATLRENRSHLALFAIVVALMLSAEPALPQGAAVVSGVVTDSSGVPVIGAYVSVDGTSLVSTTNDRGEFRLSGISAGVSVLRARRLGFTPTAREVRLAQQESLGHVELRMSTLPRTLQPVLVQANQVEYKGRLAGYYQRLQRRSAGYFISRDEIDRNSFRSLSQLLKNAPGVNAFPLRSGGAAVRMRGRGCRPLVWLDGVPLPAGEVDLDAFPASTLHGIELYLGSTTAPMDYTANNGLSSCGTILLWSRGADTEPPTRRKRQPVDLEGLVESLSAFSSDQVDKPAQLIGTESLDVIYPPELSATGVAGSVLVEFVVDTTGRIEAETVSVVSSSNPLFTAAVWRALQGAKYSAAIRGGKRVRQIVQQPFRFAPGQRKAAQGMK